MGRNDKWEMLKIRNLPVLIGNEVFRRNSSGGRIGESRNLSIVTTHLSPVRRNEVKMGNVVKIKVKIKQKKEERFFLIPFYFLLKITNLSIVSRRFGRR